VAVPLVAIVGRPDVGKAGLVNWLARRRVSTRGPAAGGNPPAAGHNLATPLRRLFYAVRGLVNGRPGTANSQRDAPSRCNRPSPPLE